jgi:glutathione S-transferase
VIYFDAPGLGEFIRLAFVAGGVEFEDVRLTKEQWGEYKSKTPYGNLPVIVDKGRVVGQSLGCARLAAKRAGIYPSDDVDAAGTWAPLVFLNRRI